VLFEGLEQTSNKMIVLDPGFLRMWILASNQIRVQPCLGESMWAALSLSWKIPLVLIEFFQL